MKAGVFPSRLPSELGSVYARCVPYRPENLTEEISLPLIPPGIPAGHKAAHPLEPTQVRFTWKAAMEAVKVLRNQAATLSHSSWWSFATQQKSLQLATACTMAGQDALASSATQIATWAAANLTATTKALEANLVLMAHKLLLRSDAALRSRISHRIGLQFCVRLHWSRRNCLVPTSCHC